MFGDWATGAVWLRTADGLNLREGGSDAHDPLDYEGNPGHGTRTCSVVCGDAEPLPGEEPPESEIGVAPRLPVVPCRIVNRVVLTPERNREAVAEGIRHVRAKGCQVISISLGIPFFPPNATGGMGRAVDQAYEEGAIVVAAGGQIIDSVTYPGKYARTIGVGGVTWQRRIWFDYDAGKEMIDVWAPAEGVLRADSVAAEGQAVMPPIEGDDPGTFSLSLDSHSGDYGKGDGTSYATVHVAAAAAMWLLLRQDEIERTYGEAWQRVEAFRRLLRTTAAADQWRAAGQPHRRARHRAAAAGRPARCGRPEQGASRQGQVVLRPVRRSRGPGRSGRVALAGGVDREQRHEVFLRSGNRRRCGRDPPRDRDSGQGHRRGDAPLGAARGRLRTLRAVPSHAPTTPHSSCNPGTSTSPGRQSVRGWAGCAKKKGRPIRPPLEQRLRGVSTIT